MIKQEASMNKIEKFRYFCRPIRIIVGLSLVAIGLVTKNYWFMLGIIPIIAGLMNFCLLCKISKKCDLGDL